MLFLDASPRISLYFPFVVLFTQLKITLTKENKEILFLETFFFFLGQEWIYHFVPEECTHCILSSGANKVSKRLYWDVFKPLDLLLQEKVLKW